MIGHSFCLLWHAGPLLRPHLPFLGPAGVPAESPHRPLGLSDLSPESLAPFRLITTSPRTRIPEGSLAEVMTTPRTLGTADPLSRVTPGFSATSVPLWAQDPLPRACPLPPSASRALLGNRGGGEATVLRNLSAFCPPAVTRATRRRAQ